MTSGIKHDTDKLQMELIDPCYIQGTAAVLTFGAKKYAPNNWRLGLTYTRVLGALMRHTNEIAKGNDIDPETGLLHAYHISCCAMFLAWYTEQDRKELDDRIKPAVRRTRNKTIKGAALTDKPSKKEGSNVSNAQRRPEYVTDTIDRGTVPGGTGTLGLYSGSFT